MSETDTLSQQNEIGNNGFYTAQIEYKSENDPKNPKKYKS